MAPVTCVADMRALAARRLPRMFLDYLECGSWTESSVAANARAFSKVQLRQRVGRDISTRRTAVRLLGTDASMPAAISPTGLSGLLHPEGELAMARAAASCGIPYALSIASSHSLEAVRRVSAGPLWLQISLLKDRAFMTQLIERARIADCAALVLTLDFHVAGQRHCDVRNGLSLPPKPSPRALLDLLCKWRWLWRMRQRAPMFGNVIGHAQGVDDMPSFQRWYAGQFELGISWRHVAWVKKQWGGPLIVKGILDADDARHALDAGADAISVSNHGGRQLDGAPAALDVLPEIVAALGPQATVLLDGGVRSGQDMLKALGMGAKGVLLGRAPLYGLAAQGEAGVRTVLTLMQKEMDLTLAMCGCNDVRDFSRAHLYTPAPEQGGIAA